MKNCIAIMALCLFVNAASANSQCQGIKDQIRSKKGSCKALPKEQRQACRSEIHQLKAQHQACKAQAKAAKGSNS